MIADMPRMSSTLDWYRKYKPHELASLAGLDEDADLSKYDNYDLFDLIVTSKYF